MGTWATTRYPTTTTGYWTTTTTRYPTTTTDYWTTTTSRYPTTTTDYWTTTTTRYPTTSTGYWTTSSQPPKDCPTGWINSMEGCFLFHHTKEMTWREAQEECEKLGGFLAEPKYQEQAALLASLAFVEEDLVGPHSWWIGLTDQGHEGRWIWQHSVEDAYFTNWADGFPDPGPNGYDCAYMDGPDRYLWSDEDCGKLTASPICQI